MAANAVVAFVLEPAPGAPEQAADDVTIRRGIRIQSTPGRQKTRGTPAETAQTTTSTSGTSDRVIAMSCQGK